jgi:DNA primase large subunit
MSESVKELEDRVLKEDPDLYCRLTFWTNIGLYYFRAADIAYLKLDKLKTYVKALEDAYEKVKGNDPYSTIVSTALDQLIRMGKTLIDAKEGRLSWYPECLKKLLDGLAKGG